MSFTKSNEVKIYFFNPHASPGHVKKMLLKNLLKRFFLSLGLKKTIIGYNKAIVFSVFFK